MTTVELLQRAWTNTSEAQLDVPPAAAREFALAKTAIEDAIMRFNRGQAEKRSVRRDFDFEKEGA